MKRSNSIKKSNANFTFDCLHSIRISIRNDLNSRAKLLNTSNRGSIEKITFLVKTKQLVRVNLAVFFSKSFF